jgi:hypothetical protein
MVSECNRSRQGYGRSQKITITASSGLSKEEIEHMSKKLNHSPIRITT